MNFVILPRVESGIRDCGFFRSQAQQTSEFDHKPFMKGSRLLRSDSVMFSFVVWFEGGSIRPPLGEPRSNSLQEGVLGDEFGTGADKAVLHGRAIESFCHPVAINCVWIILLCNGKTLPDVLNISENCLVKSFKPLVGFTHL